jgi:hypothetical protein
LGRPHWESNPDARFRRPLVAALMNRLEYWLLWAILTLLRDLDATFDANESKTPSTFLGLWQACYDVGTGTCDKEPLRFRPNGLFFYGKRINDEKESNKVRGARNHVLGQTGSA